MEYRNATVAVIGAGDFIGAAIAKKFACEGFTVFLGRIDAARVPKRAGSVAESEVTRPRRVAIDAAIAALESRRLRSGPLIIALQWLALNRGRLDRMLRARAARS